MSVLSIFSSSSSCVNNTQTDTVGVGVCYATAATTTNRTNAKCYQRI